MVGRAVVMVGGAVVMVSGCGHGGQRCSQVWSWWVGVLFVAGCGPTSTTTDLHTLV